jgi:hypothetical protein
MAGQKVATAVLELTTDQQKMIDGLKASGVEIQRWAVKAKGSADSVGASLAGSADGFKALNDSTRNWFATIAAGVATGEVFVQGLETVAHLSEEAALALPHLVESVIHLGSELLTTSLKTGISVEGLSALRYIAAQTGVDMGNLTGAIFKMEAQLGTVGDESAKVHEALSRVGLRLNDLKDMKPDQAFIAILDKLHQVPDAADRAGIGVALFGKGFKEISQLASEDVGGLIKEAQRLGIVMTTDTAAAAKAAEDAMTAFKFQIEAVGTRIGAAFLPAVVGISGDLSTLFKSALDEANKSLDSMGKSGGFLSTVAQAMGTGNGAIAAQTSLYYMLRDAIIAFVRSGIEPGVTAIGFMGMELSAARNILRYFAQDLDIVSLAYEKLAQVRARNALSFAVTPTARDEAQKALSASDAAITQTTKRIVDRDNAIRASVATEQDWGRRARRLTRRLRPG